MSALLLNKEVISYLEELRIFFRPRFVFGDSVGKNIDINSDVYAEKYSRFHEKNLTASGYLKIGAFSYMAPGVLLENTVVGRYCSIAMGVRLMGVDHPIDRVTTSTWTYGQKVNDYMLKDFCVSINQNRDLNIASNKTVIGNDVWIGENALLKRGITIGNGAIIGANAVVTKSVPPYAVVAGNPSRIIKYRFHEEIITGLLSTDWWNLNPSDLAMHDMTNIDLFIEDVLSSNYEIFDFTSHHISSLLMEKFCE